MKRLFKPSINNGKLMLGIAVCFLIASLPFAKHELLIPFDLPVWIDIPNILRLVGFSCIAGYWGYRLGVVDSKKDTQKKENKRRRQARRFPGRKLGRSNF